jgi:hypothetical protein
VSGDNDPCFGKGEWRFARFPDNSVPALLRDLQEAETETDWNSVMVRAVDELAAYEAHRNRIHEHWPRDWRERWERDRAELLRLVERGFQPPKHRAREIPRARHDAYVIATWGRARTLAEAVKFLREVYLLKPSEARSRVRLACRYGALRLVPAPRGGARKKRKGSIAQNPHLQID